jgi:predicted HTH domain antitoxin
MTPSFAIELPPEAELALSASAQDLSETAKEDLVVSLFRDGKLTHAQVSQALGLDRFETDALLKRHEVSTGGLSVEDVEMERMALEQVLGPVRR